jgi:hypothetical protein
MRKLILLIIVLGAWTAQAQVVSRHTNQISLDFTKEIKETVLPVIQWQAPALEYTSSQENRIDFKAEVNSKRLLSKVTLAVYRSLDAKPIASMDLPFESGNLVKVERTLFLQNGQNYVQIIAENVDGGIVKDTRSVIVGMDALADAISMDRKDYALLFATDQYDNWNDLVNPINDSRAIAKELEERYGFEVRIIENADQDKVFNVLREYAQKKYKPQDQLMVFFAGHGQYDEVFGEGFVVARNSIANDPSKNTYISHNRLRSIIDNIPCEHVALVMDVCFGGTFDPVLAANRAAVYEDIDHKEFIVKKLSMKTRKFLTSGSKEYVSDGVAGKHSPFAVRLLEALKTNGGEDGLLTFLEINLSMQKLQTTPRYGSFGSDQPASEFLFIAR